MKRLLSVLLVLVMMLSLLSVGAAATEGGVTGDGSDPDMTTAAEGETTGETTAPVETGE